MLSVLLVLSGCGDDSSEEDVVVEDVEPEEEQEVIDEPELPDDAPADVGGDVTEQEVAPEDSDEEEGADVPAGGDEGASEDAAAGNATSEDGSEADGGEDDDTEDDEGFTAQNYKVVSLKDLKAYPEEMTITVGTTVEWRNVNDNLQHIIGWSGQKQMGVTPEPILQGESWSYTFESPGKIVWFSTARPTVQGTIYIEE